MAQAQTQRTGWVGWIAFAAFMLMLVGGLGVMQGVIAIFNDEWVLWGANTNLLLDLTAWGVVHVIIGGLLVLAGVGVLSGNVLARTVAVILAGLSLFANFLWLPAQPVWAVVLMTIDVLVIWALTVHGSEMREA
jgi:hypothetical protein